MNRSAPLTRRTPLKARTPLKRGGPLKAKSTLARGSGQGLRRSAPLPRVRTGEPRSTPEADARRREKAAARLTAWHEFKTAVMARSGGWCEGTPWCQPGRHEAATAHHRHQTSLGGSNHPDNGIALCAFGHHLVHERIAEATAAGLLASTSEPWPA